MPQKPAMKHHTFTVKSFIGISAITVATLMIAEFLVKITAGARPSLDNIQALIEFTSKNAGRTIAVVVIDTVLMASLVVFFAALRQLVARQRPQKQWVADLAFGASLIFVALTLVGDSMDAGSALDTVGHVANASVIRALTEGHVLLFGTIGCVMIALITACFAFITLVTRVVPKWTGHLAYIVTILNLAVIPTAFGGTNATTFFSAGGTGVTLLSTFPFLVWVIAIGIVTIQDQKM